MFVAVVLLGVIAFFFLIYLNGRYNEDYWKKRGVAFYTKNKVTGPVWDYLTQDRSFFEIFCDIYKQYRNEPAVGIGSFLTPAVYVIDPKNIQHVLQNDFQAFSHRGTEVTKDDLLADNIVFMNGNRWKLMRQCMSPLFTATKLKNMYYIIDKSARDFVELLNNNPEKLKDDVFDTLSTYSCAAVGAAVFGITTKSVFDSPFLAMVRQAFKPTTISNIRFSVAKISSSLTNVLKIKLFKEHEDFFFKAIKQVIRQREKDNVKKHDFADICVMLQKKGMMKDQETGLELEPTDEILAAQAFFFFVAGVEPSATAIFATFIELGRNLEILEKVHKEVDDVFIKYNGELTYDAVNDMEYLDKVLNEALRLNPPIGFLSRKSVRDSVLPVGNIKIEKGTRVFLPIYELHHDPEYFPNPDVFDPERFSKNPKHNYILYMPFGKGGRICLGMRYARLQVKAGIIHLLRDFTLKTEVEGKIKYSKQQIQVRANNVKIEMIPRKLKSC